jgi:hypothetical protein
MALPRLKFLRALRLSFRKIRLEMKSVEFKENPKGSESDVSPQIHQDPATGRGTGSHRQNVGYLLGFFRHQGIQIKSLTGCQGSSATLTWSRWRIWPTKTHAVVPPRRPKKNDPASVRMMGRDPQATSEPVSPKSAVEPAGGPCDDTDGLLRNLPSSAATTPARTTAACFSRNDPRPFFSIRFTISSAGKARLLQRLVTEKGILSVPCMLFLFQIITLALLFEGKHQGLTCLCLYLIGEISAQRRGTEDSIAISLQINTN